MPTAKKQSELLRRVGDAYKHGDANTKKALSSNSLQKSPTLNDKIGNNKNGNNQNGNNRNGNRNGKGKPNNSGNTPGNTDSNTNTTSRNTSSGGNNNTPSTSDSSTNDRKLKRRLAMAITCSICGFECGHSDIDCFKDPTSEESKKAIEKNRSNPKMRDFFKAIDNAKRKRAN